MKQEVPTYSKELNQIFFNKHKIDINNISKKKEDKNQFVNAFKYVSYSELTNQKLDGNYSKYKKIIKKKLGNNYINYFNELRNNIGHQEDFAFQMQTILDNLGYINKENNNELKNIDSKNEDKSIDNKSNNSNNSNDENKKMDKQFDHELSAEGAQISATDEDQHEIGDDTVENNLDYFSKINSINQSKNYKFYTNEFDEIIKAEELCDLRELERLRLSLDQQMFSFKPLIAKLANRLQRKLLAQQNKHWEFNQEEGYLDTSRLAKIIANPNNTLSFKKKKILSLRIQL